MKNVVNYLESILNSNDYCVIACSGGPDSMYLLKALIDTKTINNDHIICAHVNHNVREESKEEALFVKDYCEKNNVIFEFMLIEEYDDDNFHNSARKKRYDFFESLIKKYNAKYLFTAHHGDDLMETILMRITRGSNLAGYKGFKKVGNLGNYKIIRPLIELTKKEIEDYNNNHKIPYVTDLSNNSDRYTRNRFRHHALPFFKSEDESVHLKFLKFSEELNKYDEYITNYICNNLKNAYANNTIIIDEFLKCDQFIQEKIVELLIEEVQNVDIFPIEKKHTDLILKTINQNKANVKIELPNNYIGLKRYNEFTIIKSEITEDYKLILEDELKVNNFVITRLSQDINDNSNYIIRLNSKEIKLPLYVRNKKDGDKIKVKNLNGSKKIKDIFINEKIDVLKRSCWPIVVDQEDQVLWIPGIKKSKFDHQLNESYDIILKCEEDTNEIKK